MPNLDTLDTLIAVMTVLLILSLIVQSIQEAIKKLFKLKSKQIEESLKDLFEKVFSKDGKENEKFLQRSRSQTMQKLAPSSNPASGTAQDVFEIVMKEFGKLGRFRKIVPNFPLFSNRKEMLNSISKEDLMKVLGRIGPDKFISDFTGQLKTAIEEVTKLKEALETVAGQLDGQAGVNFAKLREAVTPLLNDLQAFFKGSNLDGLLLSDVLALRNVKFSDLLGLLGAAQKSVDDELAGTPAPDDTRKHKLEDAKKGLGTITSHLTNLNQKLDDTLAPLRVKLAEVEKWYDTVMQSFEERYNRSMQATAFFIGLVVAVTLNANIFTIYRDISTQPDKRAAILKVSEEAMEIYKERLAQTLPTPTPQPESAKLLGTESNSPSGGTVSSAPTPTPTPEPSLTGATSSTGQPLSTPSPTPAPSPTPNILKEAKEKLDKDVAIYSDFGFLSHFAEWEALGVKKWNPVGRSLYMGLGWLLMAALLSVGAPFWNDTLQSLFGVKNLLRKKSNTTNTDEGRSGTDQSAS